MLLQNMLVSFSLSPLSHSKHYYTSTLSAAAAVQTGESNYLPLWGAHSHLPTGRPSLTYSGGKQALRMGRPLWPKHLAAFLSRYRYCTTLIKTKHRLDNKLRVFFFLFFFIDKPFFSFSRHLLFQNFSP